MKLWRKFRAMLSRGRIEREMTEEMQAHLDELTARNLAAGLPPEEARYVALRAFGGVEQIKEQCRDQQETQWIEGIWRDLRFSFRSLRRSKAFSLTVILTLALCIGANSTIFTVLYGLVIKPLPFPDAGQVVDIYNMRPKEGQMRLTLGVRQYLDYREQADLFAGVAMWKGWMFNIGEEGGTMRYVGMQVTHEYFSVLGLQPLKGRFFREDDGRPGQDNVAVLTQSYWENSFHGDPDIVGKVVRLSGEPHTIIGVAPRKFEQMSIAPILFKPMTWAPEHAQQDWRYARVGSITARVKSGVSHGMALAQLQAIEQRFQDSEASPGIKDYLQRSGQRMGLGQLREEQVAPIKKGLLLLQGGAFLGLILGCVNVASLMLARANARRTELAVRQALGASRSVLARQLLVEAALLAVAGAVLGLVLTATTLGVINSYTYTIVYGMPPVAIDGGVLGTILAVSLVVALLIGLLPVGRIWRLENLQDAMQSGARGASRGGSVRAVSGVLVVAQVALALVLLVGAGLLIRSFTKVMAINPGFDVNKVFHARVAYDASYTDMAKLQGLQSRIIEKMREIPGVESVATSSYQPGHAALQSYPLPIRGVSLGQEGTFPTAIVVGISPEYLPTMGIRLLEGRNFTVADQVPGARQVLIVDRSFAERHFSDRSPVGQMFAFGEHAQNPDKAPLIIGVAETARVAGLEKGGDEPMVYMAMGTSQGGLSMEFRSSRRMEEIMPLIRAKLREVDPALPISGIKSFREQLDEGSAIRRGVMWLLGAYAGIALVLAAVGIYGMLAYDVTQRTKEIGVRGAIGATQGQIVALILRQGLVKAGLGMAIGLAGALVMARVMESLLYEVRPRDPLIFTTVAFVLLGVALLASWLPARRAAKVDPMVALRCE